MVVNVHPKILALRILKANLNDGLPYQRLLREMRQHGSRIETAQRAISELSAEGCVVTRPSAGVGKAVRRHHYITEKGAELFLRYIATEPLGSSQT